MPTTVVQTYTYQVGTIDLTQFCNCPSPCATCCGQSCGSCSGLPTTLHVTVTSNGNDCTCAHGAVWTCVFDNVQQAWLGTLDLFAFGCTADNLPGGSNLNMKIACSGGVLALTLSNASIGECLQSGSVTITPSSTTCSPLNVVYPSVSILDCCNGVRSPTVVFTLTT